MQKGKKFLSAIPTSSRLPGLASARPRAGGRGRVSYQLSASSGFTLVELLVVVAVFGLLASLVLANFNAARERARDVQRKSDLDQIKKSLRMYYNNDNQYPDNSGDNIVGCGTTSSPVSCPWDGANSWKQTTSGEDMIYMKILPQDPSYDSDTGTPRYKYLMDDSDSQDFCLWATLENKSDGDISRSQGRCSGCSVGSDDYVVCGD